MAFPAHRLSVAVLSLAALTLSLGCSKKSDSPKPVALPSFPQATDEQGEAFAEAMEQAVATADGAAFDRLVNWDALIDRTMAGLEQSDDWQKGFKQGMLSQASSLSAQIIPAVQKGGSYRFLRVQNRDGVNTALFRLLLPDSGGVNYHWFLLGKQPDGAVRAIDFHVAVTGELMSQTFRRFALLTADHTGLLAKLSGQEQEFLKNIDKFKVMQDHIKAGKAPAALATYQTLPEDMRRDKGIMVMRIAAAQGVDEKEYLAALEDLQKFHPNDPSAALMSIDYHALSGRLDQAIAAIDTLDKSVGGDPYLNVLRASFRLQEKDYPAATELAQKAIDGDPKLLDAYFVQVASAVGEQNFARTVELLNTINDNFKVEFADFTADPIYAEFIQSPEYAEWMESRGEK